MTKEPSDDPYKTILVIKSNGKEVGRIPATAQNREAYIQSIVRTHENVTVDHEYDENAGILGMLHGPTIFGNPYN